MFIAGTKNNGNLSAPLPKIPWEFAHELYMAEIVKRITVNRASVMRKKTTKYPLMTYDQWCDAFKDGLLITIPHFQISKRAELEFETEEEYVKRISTIL